MAVGDPEASDWSRRRVLITGAAGLLAGSVARELPISTRLVGLDIAWQRVPIEESLSIERFDGDVRDTALLRQLLDDLDVDTVLHLAAQTLVGPAVRNPVETFSSNIEGTWSVLEACRTADTVKAIVVASSDKAYGDWSGRPYREDMALRGRHPYDVSKAATDLVAQSYAATYDLPVAITRCGNLYGGGDLNWSRVVPGTIRSILEGQRPVIRSDGSPVRDYLHVSDAARGVIRLAQAVRDQPDLRGEAFNFAGGNRHTTIEVVRRILLLMDSELEPDIRAEDLKEIPEQRIATAHARRTLGWQPAVPFDDGLREAIAWYRRYLAPAK